jgi:hypothetical protein
MKLYTEEQIFQYLLEHGTIDLDSFILDIHPIELPSDEEIENKINNDIHIKSDADFFNGAKWMRDKIQGGNQ